MTRQGTHPLLQGARALAGSRRRVATVFAVVLAGLCGWHAVFGANGITAYAAKRTEDKALRLRIEALQTENAGLKHHVDHLQSDPDTIEMEARQRLHYTRAGEVIYTLNNTPKSTPNRAPGDGAAGRPRP